MREKLYPMKFTKQALSPYQGIIRLDRNMTQILPGRILTFWSCSCHSLSWSKAPTAYISSSSRKKEEILTNAEGVDIDEFFAVVGGRIASAVAAEGVNRFSDRCCSVVDSLRPPTESSGDVSNPMHVS